MKLFIKTLSRCEEAGMRRLRSKRSAATEGFAPVESWRIYTPTQEQMDQTAAVLTEPVRLRNFDSSFQWNQ